MKEVTLEGLKELANRLLFDMSDSEYKTLLEEFKTVVKQMEVISLDKTIDSYEPMSFPFPCEVTNLREDIPTASLDRNEALKNAKNKLAGQIKLPKVVSWVI